MEEAAFQSMVMSVTLTRETVIAVILQITRFAKRSGIKKIQ